MNRFAVVGVMVVAGAVLAGCGDDDASALSEEEFLRQGNAICAEGNAKLDAAFEEQFGDLEDGEQPDPDDAATLVLDTLVPAVEQQLDDLEDLEPPEDMANTVEELFEDARSALEELEQQVKDDPSSVLRQEEDPFADVNARADEIGLTECGGEDSEDGEDGEDGEETATADIVPDPDHPYCDVERKVDELFGAAFAGLEEDSSEEEQQAAMQGVAQQIIDDGLIEEAMELVPDVIRADLDVLAAAVQQFAAGEFDSPEADASDVAGERVDAFCGQE